METPKDFLRKKAKAELKAYFSDKNLAQQCAKTVFDYFINSEEYKKAPLISAYLSMSDEIDLSLIINKALEDGKKVAVPRMIPNSSEMDFYFIDSLETSFSTDNKYGIREPSENCPKVNPSEIPENSIFLCPGLAFNLTGTRLGRGKGYYDRYLSRITSKNVLFCGVCPVNVITKMIPEDKNDIKMTHLLCEYGFIHC